MAKKFYASNNSLSDEVVKWYASVNGLSKKVVKAYCSVNGLSKQFFGDSGVLSENWEYYETQARKFIEALYSFEGTPQDYTKANNGIAYFAIIEVTRGLYAYYYPILLSTDSNAISLSGKTNLYSGNLTINNDTWYYAIPNYNAPLKYANIDNVFTPDCRFNNTRIYTLSQQDSSEPASDLLDYIYSNCFAQDYQDNQTYNLIYADKRKTFKRILGIFLYKNAQVADVVSSVSYRSLLSLVETIASDMASQSYSLVEVMCNFWGTSSSIKYVEIDCHYSNDDLSSKRVWNKSANEGYTRLNLVEQLSYIKTKRYWINENEGTLRTAESTSYAFSGTIGAIVSYNAPSQYERGIYYHAECTNIGLVL